MKDERSPDFFRRRMSAIETLAAFHMPALARQVISMQWARMAWPTRGNGAESIVNGARDVVPFTDYCVIRIVCDAPECLPF